MKKLFNLSFIYLGLGLILGVFHREFTKFNNFSGETVLGTIKDKSGNLILNDRKSEEFEYTADVKTRINASIKFTNFYGQVELDVI